MGKGGEDVGLVVLVHLHLPKGCPERGRRKRSPPTNRHEVPKHLDKSRSGAPTRRYEFEILISDHFEPCSWPFNVAHAHAVFQSW